jgi:hypothetical protein
MQFMTLKIPPSLPLQREEFSPINNFYDSPLCKRGLGGFASSEIRNNS